ncbi:hypothetical protein SAMN05660462_01672 [Proteiniborus ethanoligenes]|uniref:DUF7408 domain-containing protein n=2 Tax=Proteiniborus ethanoligenes TaxID=415015 RepID=A0A1H3PV55_9FIRM|nr:hypothetical protein SAMN05660462_01672 [Proteiniborus ethanoligenes]
MHNSIRKILLIFLSLIIFSLGFSMEAYGEEAFEVKSNVGFNGFYKYEYDTPISIEIKNNLKDVKGKVQVLFQVISYSGKKLYVAHTKELDIAKGATKTVTMEINNDRYTSKYAIRILDNNDKVIWEEKALSMPTPKSSNTLGIGILSDDIESLRYLTLMAFSDANNRGTSRNTSICEIDNFPTNPKHLNMLDMILINNYNTENLNSDQKEALKKWIEDGGVLLIGTGPNYSKTLKDLDDLNFVKINGSASITEFNDMKDTYGRVFQPNIPLSIINAELIAGKVELKEDNQPIIFSSNKGNGKVIIFGFDLGLSPFVEWEGRVKYLEKFLDGSTSWKYSLDMAARNSNSNSRYSYLNRYLPKSKVPSVKVMIIILMAFTLVVGPINYIVLKKLDKRELAWITIPSLAVLASSIILLWGTGGSFKNPLMNNISIISFNKDMTSVDINTSSGVISFKNGSVDIKGGENVNISIPANEVRAEYLEFNEDDIVLEYILNKNKTISFKKRGVWDVQQVTFNESKRLDNGIIQEIKLKDNALTGEIKNNSGLELKDAIIFYGLDYYRIGDIKSGDAKKIDFKLNTTASSNQTASMYRKDFYQVLDSIYPWNRGPRTNVAQEDILPNEMKREILEGFFGSNTYYDNENSAFLIAWNTDKLLSDITVNGKATDRIDRNLFTMPIEIGYEPGELVNIPYGILSLKILELSSLHLDTYDKSLHGQGYVIMSAKPEDNIELEKMDINLIYGNVSSSHKVWIYNYERDEWETYNSFTISIDMDNRDIYYDEAYGTQIKIELDGRDYIRIPTFSVKGVAK